MNAQACPVLVVVDDTSVAEAIRDGVLLAGYRIVGTVGTADEAVLLADRHRPRLAVIDVDLHDSRGGRLLRIGPIGILYITGFPDKVRTADVGHGWMSKPYRVLDLINGLKVIEAASERRPIDTPIPPALSLIN
ncbi:MAG: hypothetical protein HY060_17985 [Proteobacteria bacterium]|nr:hypothetical protein [Pseudomonadota bacterium]